MTHFRIDVASRGALLGKMENGAYKLLEEIAANNNQCLVERLSGRRAQGVHEIKALSSMNTKLDMLVNILNKMGMHNGQSSPTIVCEICDHGHKIVECQVGSSFTLLK